eukprot:CAMPEP_0185780890 /NCGR_PEP_ID=MMETSP1174-20130828/100519_1 /TAXON_ID=35687 /ORGANISM="Dictyocha speculum, Strain CCMP1381" /LENGTH=162 /DNA_ID=CAMNT_0028470635 /DNA_START=601 /DNA_END=1089 /DNA_ORIENTATION=+
MALASARERIWSHKKRKTFRRFSSPGDSTLVRVSNSGDKGALAGSAGFRARKNGGGSEVLPPSPRPQLPRATSGRRRRHRFYRLSILPSFVSSGRLHQLDGPPRLLGWQHATPVGRRRRRGRQKRAGGTGGEAGLTMCFAGGGSDDEAGGGGNASAVESNKD